MKDFIGSLSLAIVKVMNADKKAKLLDMLKEGDSNEIPFSKTKANLLEAGYSEQEVSHAIYERPYDGKKNIVNPENEATKAFRANPELTEKIGAQILEDAQRNDRTEAVAIGAATRFAPGRHAEAKYSFHLFQKLGLPFFRIFFAVLMIYALVYIFNLPNLINQVVIILIGLWIAWSFYRQYLKK
jgi:hypothetical protein